MNISGIMRHTRLMKSEEIDEIQRMLEYAEPSEVGDLLSRLMRLVNKK